MNYALIVNEGPAGLEKRKSPIHRGAYLGAWLAFAKRLGQSGALKGGAGLQPPNTARTVYFTDAGIDVRDGSFAISLEQLGGFFIVEAADADAALALAKQAPLAAGDAIEVRPVLAPPA